MGLIKGMGDHVVEEFRTLFSNILSSELVIDLQDSIERRKLFAKFEVYCMQYWDNLNYGTLSGTTEDGIPNELIQSLATASAAGIEFSTGTSWFGGLSDTAGPSTSLSFTTESSVPLWSSLIILGGFGAINQDVVGYILKKLRNDFGSVDKFLEVLIESDERLLCVLLAILELHRRKSYAECDFWDPLTLCMTMLIKLDFSESMFIDWLASDPISVPFIFRFFGEMGKNPESLQKAVNSLVGLSFEENIKDFQEIPIKYSINTKVGITEIHGNISVEKEMVFDKKIRARITTKEISVTYDEIVDNFNGMLNRLQARLLSANRHGTLPMNVNGLIKVVSKVKELGYAGEDCARNV
uniref:Rab-GAP TBC domain-containing protein n=1 Tax=Bursaphelenchus xylophilus TaxID=6326 RepID=A0A1I7S452_BURXY